MHQQRHARRHPRNKRSSPQRPLPAPIRGAPKTPLHGAFRALIPALQHAVAGEGYTTPTPIQEQAIEPIVAGKDLLGCAQTGTGKTAAFALPILQHLARKPHSGNSKRRPIRALVLSPTRELAHQIMESFKTYGKHLNLYHTVVYGGVSQVHQVRDLHRGVDILVATPGRLMDLMDQGHVRLSEVDLFVLDEADRMMDMGFIGDIRKIMEKLPRKRQNLMFSATMPPKIRELAQTILHHPVEISIEPEKPSVEAIEQSVYPVDGQSKFNLLKHLLEDTSLIRVIVFVRTKRRADNIERKLRKMDVAVDIIHSGRSQRQRDRTIDKFRNARTRVLVASDVVSRGLDVDDITHVINYDMPEDAETYVHRIGRTGRAGAAGIAYSFCSHEEWSLLRDVEQHIRKELIQVKDHPFGITYKTRGRARKAEAPRKDGSISRPRKRPGYWEQKKRQGGGGKGGSRRNRK